MTCGTDELRAKLVVAVVAALETELEELGAQGLCPVCGFQLMFDALVILMPIVSSLAPDLAIAMVTRAVQSVNAVTVPGDLEAGRH